MNHSIRFELHDSCKNLPLTEWQNLVPEKNLLHNPGYLELLENSLQNGTKFIYAAVKQNNALIAAAYFQVVTFKGTQLSDYTKNAPPVARSFYNIILNLINVKLLVGANLLMTGEKGFFASAAFTENEKWSIYSDLVEYILSSRKSLNGYLITDVFEHDDVLSNHLQKHNFHHIHEEPDMELVLDKEWQSFQDYTNALSSKYRVRAKKCLSLSDGIQRSALNLDDLYLFENELYALYQNTIQRASFSLVELEANYFAKQKKLLPDNYHVFGYFINGKLVGFNSIFTLDGKGEVHYIGLDYKINTSTHLYQRMLMDAIEFGITNRLSTLHFGRTATEMKCSIGATPIPVHGFVKHKNPIINKLVVAKLSKAIKAKHYVYRNPFKQM